MYNPDVRRSRHALHEPVPGTDVAKTGAEWRVQHEERYIGTDAGNVSMFNVLGFKRVDPVEEFFPETKRA